MGTDGGSSRRSGDVSACVTFLHEAGSDYEHTEDHYQVLVAEQVIAEEVHRRSPATRSYTQAQARGLFEHAGFNPVELYSQLTFEPVRADDAVFTVVGHKAGAV
jgi:hypothetical protein